mgnify:CR=1 FL=1
MLLQKRGNDARCPGWVMRMKDRRLPSQGPSLEARTAQSTLEIDIFATPALEHLFETVYTQKIGHPRRGIAAPQAAASFGQHSTQRSQEPEAYRGAPDATCRSLDQQASRAVQEDRIPTSFNDQLTQLRP